MKRKIVILALLSALLCSCAANTGNSISSDMTSVTSEMSEDVTSETESKPETSEPESKPETSEAESSEAGTVQTSATTKPAETTVKPVETTVKPAETTTKPAETTTKPVETEKPAPEWTETAASGVKYVNTSCYSRKKAVIGSEAVAQYNINDKVKIMAKTNTGYYKIDTGAFIHSDYLSDRKVTVQTTVTTTTKPAATEKPASVPTATSDPVDEKYYANNPPAIDEAWLEKKYREDYVGTAIADQHDTGTYLAFGDGSNTGLFCYYGLLKRTADTWTVGVDIPEGWYSVNASYATEGFVPDIQSIVRSNGYSIPRDVYYSGKAMYLAKGDKITGQTGLMPIPNGKVEDIKVYDVEEQQIYTESYYIVGKGLPAGTYKVKELPQKDLALDNMVEINNEYAYNTNVNWQLTPKTITVKTGDFVIAGNVELIKVS